MLVLRNHVEHLAELTLDNQRAVFGEVAMVAAAIRRVFTPSGSGPDVRPLRINYECLGNQVAHVHWHVIPRHADDPQPRDTVWHWSRETIGEPPDAQALKDLAENLRCALRP